MQEQAERKKQTESKRQNVKEHAVKENSKPVKEPFKEIVKEPVKEQQAPKESAAQPKDKTIKKPQKEAEKENAASKVQLGTKCCGSKVMRLCAAHGGQQRLQQETRRAGRSCEFCGAV